MEALETVSITVGGKKVNVPRNTSTSQIRKISGLEQSQILARSSNGTNKIVHGNITVMDGDTFTVGRSFTKGSMNDGKLLTDLEDLSTVFDIEVDERLNWVIINDYGLPPGFNRDKCDLLINVEAYPLLPPGNVYGVYLDKGLEFRGKKMPNYYQALDRSMFGRKWAWYCTGKMSWDPKKDDITTFLMTLDMMLGDPLVETDGGSGDDKKASKI